MDCKSLRALFPHFVRQPISSTLEVLKPKVYYLIAIIGIIATLEPFYFFAIKEASALSLNYDVVSSTHPREAKFGVGIWLVATLIVSSGLIALISSLFYSQRKAIKALFIIPSLFYSPVVLEESFRDPLMAPYYIAPILSAVLYIFTKTPQLLTKASK